MDVNSSSPLNILVPNAPCGVESHIEEEFVFLPFQFLMHRVELKERI